jgi:hypothetical protein
MDQDHGFAVIELKQRNISIFVEIDAALATIPVYPSTDQPNS